MKQIVCAISYDTQDPPPLNIFTAVIGLWGGLPQYSLFITPPPHVGIYYMNTIGLWGDKSTILSPHYSPPMPSSDS